MLLPLPHSLPFATYTPLPLRYRFELEKNETILKFLKENNMEYHPIDREAKMELAPKLVACGFRLNHDDVMATDYFKVDFEQAVELVKQRKVYLQKGSAYIPKSEILTIIVGAFRAKLSAALTVSGYFSLVANQTTVSLNACASGVARPHVSFFPFPRPRPRPISCPSLQATSKALPNLEEDSRLLPMLANLSKQYLGNDYAAGGKSKNEISAAAIPGLAEESFPLCMRHSHDALMTNHHLKHGARMQYGLFLKGIGLTLEEALMFWRSEFCKSMPGDKVWHLRAAGSFRLFLGLLLAAATISHGPCFLPLGGSPCPPPRLSAPPDLVRRYSSRRTTRITSATTTAKRESGRTTRRSAA